EVEIAYLSLLVGPGTFEPIRTDDFTQHKMHKEYFEISEETCAKINTAKKTGKKIWAVGTTVVKALETAARSNNDETNFPARVGKGLPEPSSVLGQGLKERSFSGDSDLFIYPLFEFKIVDGLITNYHWPRSSLILLVAAFAGKDQVLPAYKEAIANRYRFFSYGDAMLIY
ncbi:MAG TPA: S-adenosylmethionine:tRNA ribosyltransferase-isomerase, partial [candidate division Zixibacteria bacterium]|nr:S-adenosylmethionine:tRNA ribosyltransferase-isomerase [candidate division Zixibacteria bacterium]